MIICDAGQTVDDAVIDEIRFVKSKEHISHLLLSEYRNFGCFESIPILFVANKQTKNVRFTIETQSNG